METHELDIEVRPDGTVKVHIRGAKGPSCMEYTKLFEQILNSTGEAERTSEYYEPPTGVQIRLDQKTRG